MRSNQGFIHSFRKYVPSVCCVTGFPESAAKRHASPGSSRDSFTGRAGWARRSSPDSGAHGAQRAVGAGRRGQDLRQAWAAAVFPLLRRPWLPNEERILRPDVQLWRAPLSVAAGQPRDLAEHAWSGSSRAPVQEGAVGRGGRVLGGFVAASGDMRSHIELTTFGDSPHLPKDT